MSETPTKVPAAGAEHPAGAPSLRSRLGRLAPRSGSKVPTALEPVLAGLRQNHPKSDEDLVVRAYDVAARVHEGQFRESGAPYITHPVAVASILADMGMTDSTLAAALLHDTVEDTPYSLDELREDFGEEIALLVDGVTKLDKVTYGRAAKAETLRKMVVATAKDIRVLVIKLADRLHNARTWKYVEPEKAARKASETLEIYAPLAHRLGMNTIKWELEDLAFETLYPKVYQELVRVVAERAPAREEYLSVVIEQVKADLRKNKLKAQVTGRPKHYYSIYQKMIVRGRDFADIYDLVGIRILVDTIADCYAALGAMHARWNPVPGRFKDYIAIPKFNLYQSLHTTVIGPSRKPVEIQIRTHDMHRRAEYGVAAHWKYKEAAKGNQVDSGANDLAWLRQLVEWQRETTDPEEFLEDVRFEISGAEVYAFTPKGDVIVLPSGATPVDFAYAVHTEVGDHTMGARVNTKLVSLDTELVTGDVVEIFTSKAENAGPSRDWLNFVKSPRARAKIRHWFSRERREEAVEAGKDAISKALRKQNLPIQRLMPQGAMVSLAAELRYSDIESLYAAVGEGHVSAENIVRRLVAALGGESANEDDVVETTRPGTRERSHRTAETGIIVHGLDDVWVKLAKCCTPVPRDPIVGFVTRGSGVSVHRADCQNVVPLRDEPERMIDVEWADHVTSTFLVQVQVEALDRARLLADVSRVLSDHHVSILSASVTTTKDRLALSRFVFEMAEPGHLEAILSAIRQVDGVFDVYRVTGSKRPESASQDA